MTLPKAFNNSFYLLNKQLAILIKKLKKYLIPKSGVSFKRGNIWEVGK
jgi:hypothetical protein